MVPRKEIPNVLGEIQYVLLERNRVMPFIDEFLIRGEKQQAQVGNEEELKHENRYARDPASERQHLAK